MKIDSAWVASKPETRLANEEDVISHLSWPQDRGRQDLERLVRLGLPFRVIEGRRLFDAYEVFFYMRRIGDPLWQETVLQARQYASQFAQLKSKIPFQILFEREHSLNSSESDCAFHTHFPVPNEAGISVVPMGQAGLVYKQDGAVFDIRAPSSLAVKFVYQSS